MNMFDKTDLHLIRVLHTVLTERSVSRAALRLGMHQPAVSTALKRLRELAGDPLLVRSGSGMVPTVAGLQMVEPAAHILRSAETLFANARSFDPASARQTFSLAASDYLDPFFLPQLVVQIKAAAPLCRIDIQGLNAGTDYRQQLASGECDVVIGNWLRPPGDLHLGRLFGDEVVCLVANGHPALRRPWGAEDWLAAEHVAPSATHLGALGFVDEHLGSLGLVRHIATRCPHFGLMPAMVAGSLLVLTTGRQYCERFLSQLPVQIVPCPVAFPRMLYYQLWHERSHSAQASRWLRDQVKSVAAALHRPVADGAAAALAVCAANAGAVPGAVPGVSPANTQAMSCH